MSIKDAIANGNVEAAETALRADTALANQKITWGKNNELHSDPLHFVSDCVFNGDLTNGCEGDLTRVLLKHGAAINGSPESETPLIAATSLGASKVAKILIESGADVHATALFGASALHWAAYMGMDSTVQQLISAGSGIEETCNEFKSTPLFWAVQGYSCYGPEHKSEQVNAAAALIRAGADVNTRNIEGASALERSREGIDEAMTQLLTQNGASEATGGS